MPKHLPECLLDTLTFKKRLLSLSMRKTGKQVGSGCRQTAESSECLCKHCACPLPEIKQQEIKTHCTPDGDYWEKYVQHPLLLAHNSVKHAHTHKQRATFTQGLLNSTAHSVVHKFLALHAESHQTEFHHRQQVLEKVNSQVIQH